jgi:hypothetical protein
MMHIVHSIQRRFPSHSNKIIALLALASATGVAIGIAVLFAR